MHFENKASENPSGAFFMYNGLAPSQATKAQKPAAV
ncbi:hypothetical protein RD1_4075 [Roseobacter denitrificans OCh 114]|uniref:Uncharacterized protein n=1 Tax=Roseobacter denitrificans (strain ATCC 33942 / OCh 114) TaxID=375451 RepID=Q160S4_ROSDO|nr:hypothetical protein RD1_4075 [Roseobacter denitrificans OCh 114]